MYILSILGNGEAVALSIQLKRKLIIEQKNISTYILCENINLKKFLEY